jgi:integrase
VRLAYADPVSERDGDIWDARVFGHEQATTWDFSGIEQRWLRQVAKDWAFVAQTRVPLTVQARLRSLARFSAQLARRPGGGHNPTHVGRADVEAFAVALNRAVLRGEVTNETRRAGLKDVRSVLDDARAVGLLEGVTDTFALTKDLIPPYVATEEEPGQALPDMVVERLSTPSALAALRRVAAKAPGVMGDDVGQQWVVLFQALRDTGRRPAELTSLGVDAVSRDHDGGPILVYDNRKSRRHGRRLPIGEDLHATLWAWRQVVVARFPDTPTDQLALFPRPTRNREGTKPMLADQLSHKFGDWIAGLERIDGPDRDSAGQPVAFDRNRIYPYAFRHTYAQRHADAGTPVEVLQALMDHTDIKTTQGYFRVTSKRKRQATEQLARMRRGANSDPRPLAALSETRHVRDAVAQVAVPFGLCAEPANVQAGGQHCPIRYRCLGCDSFTSDPSFLPDLRAHLDELLRARERGQAMGANDWALVPIEEITRLRGLIRGLEADLTTLPEQDRHLVERACTDLRTARRTVPVSIGWRTS